jgi:indolepyruvate decarboxylase
VAELARRLAIPVVTSFMGRGVLTGHDVPVLGAYLGLAGSPEVSKEVEQSDGLLLLGVIVSDTNFAVSAQRIDLRFAIQALNGQVVMGHHVYPDLPLGHVVDALLERVPSRRVAAQPQPLPPRKRDDDAPIDEDAAVVPADIARAVNRLLLKQGEIPLACDVGDCLFTAMDIDPTALIAPGYYAGMGYGVPAGLGLQAATGNRPLILVGDGAFQMTGWELGNAQRYGWDPVVLVFNNASWEMLRAFEPDAGFNDLGTWDFASMAGGMGGDGHLVRTCGELERALDKAWATRGRFQLLDIRIAQGARSPTLNRFVQAVKRLSSVG